ncbi:MAG TPA: cell division protein ZipA C-terminal FtsZ-binding domain-containing protein [Steroidobacteraceae bacterium]|nr:cell division protein ZipA C-terminal FtsZ-binding domain-containing protein [Steroidobacteraceae bacterium]
MAAELRWVLLGLSLPLLAGIWWWTARRSRQAPGNAELRESTMPPDPHYSVAGAEEMMAAPEMRPSPETRPAPEMRPAPETRPGSLPEMRPGAAPEMRAAPGQRDWGVPPFEPLSIRTGNYDGVPVLDGPMMVGADPPPTPTPPAPRAAPVTPAASSAPPALSAAELQRIVTIRVCAVGETRWSGNELLTALEMHGLAFGRYQVFHRKHVDGRSLFCVASLIEPGTFDVAMMPDQEFRGVTLFAVLPGPIVPLETVDELFRTARGLAEELSGMVQDAKGMPLSPQRAAAVREDVARFQASLSGN